jgi:tetratricopeptide (TPR) repeat protein
MFSRCVELEPHSHLYWFRFSQTLGWTFKWDGALEACEKALELHATAPRQYVTARQMLTWKGECLFMLQRYTEAADIYRFVIQIDDFVQRAGSYSQLARCYERIGAYREAVDAREREVRERADSFSEALKAGEFDNIDEAIVEIERSFLGEAWLELGRCYALAGNIEAAEWAFRRAVEVDAESTRARTELAALLRHAGRVEDAEKQFQHALMLAARKVGQTPELASAHSDLAFVYRAMGNYSEADQAAERAADLGWRSSDEQRPVFSLDASVADSSR